MLRFFSWLVALLSFVCLQQELQATWNPRVANQFYVGPLWSYRKTSITPTNGELTSPATWGVTIDYLHLKPKALYLLADLEYNGGTYRGGGALAGARSSINSWYFEADTGYTIPLTCSLRWLLTPVLGYRHSAVFTHSQTSTRRTRHSKEQVLFGLRLDWLASCHWNAALRVSVLSPIYGVAFVKPADGEAEQQFRLQNNMTYEAWLPITWFSCPTGAGWQLQLTPFSSYIKCFRPSQLREVQVASRHYVYGLRALLGYGF